MPFRFASDVPQHLRATTLVSQTNTPDSRPDSAPVLPHTIAYTILVAFFRHIPASVSALAQLRIHAVRTPPPALISVPNEKPEPTEASLSPARAPPAHQGYQTQFQIIASPTPKPTILCPHDLQTTIWYGRLHLDIDHPHRFDAVANL